MATKDNFNYDKAKQDIEKIMKELNDPELTISALKDKVKEAVQLIDACKDALGETREELERSMNQED